MPVTGGVFGLVLFGLILCTVLSQNRGYKPRPLSRHGRSDGCAAFGTEADMASFKKSFESLKGASHSAAKGVSESTVQAAQDAVQQVADSSKETVSAAAQDVSRQTQATIGKTADKASDSIKEFGQNLHTK